jgi:hypothetical protein
MGVLRWLILFLAGLRVLPTASASAWRFIFPLVLFLVVVIALASFTSPQFTVSLLKVTIFSYCAATALAAYDSIGERDRENLKVWFLCLTIAVVVLSLPTVVLRASYLGAGFRGIFIHCQLFGTFLAPPASYVLAGLLFHKGPHVRWQWAFGVLCLAMIVLSRARTGMLALLLSLAATMVFGFCSSRREEMQLVPARTLLKIGGSIAFIIILVATSSVFSKRVEGFWLKGDENKKVDITQAFYNSRGAGMAGQWKHFLKQPLTGNGFGVDVWHFNPKGAVTFMGIPISSPSEKGFLPVAVLEEIGLIGVAVLIPLVVLLILGALGQRDIGLIAMCLSCFLINIGEAVFFSPGYLGGYLWLLIGLTTARGLQADHET